MRLVDLGRLTPLTYGGPREISVDTIHMRFVLTVHFQIRFTL